MKLFGIDITINFGGDLVEKYDRYNELTTITDSYEDDPQYYQEDEDGEEHQAKRALISEQVDLFYELKEEGYFSSSEEEDDDEDDNDEPEPEQQPNGGFLGWLFG